MGGDEGEVRYAFEDYVMNSDRRELTLSGEPIAVGPQIFDLLLPSGAEPRARRQ